MSHCTRIEKEVIVGFWRQQKITSTEWADDIVDSCWRVDDAVAIDDDEWMTLHCAKWHHHLPSKPTPTWIRIGGRAEKAIIPSASSSSLNLVTLTHSRFFSFDDSAFDVIFDEHLSFSDQISALSKSCHHHIRALRCIRPYLDLHTAKNSCHLHCTLQAWLL